MEQNEEFVFNPNQELTLKEMKSYLGEWYSEGLIEEINNINFEKFDRELILRDKASGESVFSAIFEYGLNISDDSTVYICGIANKELQGIIAKMIYLDKQIANAKIINENQQPQKQ